MADNLTDTVENLALDWINGVGTPTRPSTTNLNVALITTTTPSTDSVNGSEVSGGSYARQGATLGAAASGASSNTGAITFTNMPACVVGGIELWNPAGTTRVWHGTLAANKTVNSGDTFTIAIGDLDVSLG